MELTDVELIIEELDLGDVPAPRRHVVVAALERELVRLLEARPLTSPPGDVATLDVPAVRARPDGDPVVFGTELATAVHTGLRRWSP